MKGFEFNLNKVLEVRDLEEDLARNKLREARQKSLEIEGYLNRLNELQTELYQFLRQEDDLSLEERVQGRNYLYRHRQEINRTEENLNSQYKRVSKCRSEFLNKRKERQALEKLRKKELKRYNKDLFDKEQKELDEVGQRVSGLQGV